MNSFFLRLVKQSELNPVSTFILEDSNLIKYFVFVDDNGDLQTRSGASGTVTDIKVSGGSLGEVSFGVSVDGEIQSKIGGDLSGTATLNDNFRIRSIGGFGIFKIKVSADDEIETEAIQAI